MDTYLTQLKEMSYIVSGKNKLYNFEEWKNNKQPLLFIAGLSGAGKSTIGWKLSHKHNAHYIALDILDNKFRYKMMKKLKKHDVNDPEIVDLSAHNMIQIFKGFEKIKRKTVIEGIQILFYGDKKYWKNKSVIILGASALLSSMRAFIRDRKRYGDEETMVDTIKDLYLKQKNFIKHLKEFEKMLG